VLATAKNGIRRLASARKRVGFANRIIYYP